MTFRPPFTRRAALALTAACVLCGAARAQDPTLFLGDSPNKDAAKEVKNILLRPNAGAPFYAYVNNPSPNDRTVTAVLLAANGREISRSGAVAVPGNGRVPVTFAAPPAPTGAGAPAAAGPLPLAGSKVRLQLLDEKGKEIQASDLELAFQTPAQYARAEASFTGDRTDANVLTVRVTVDPVGGTAPVKVKLDLSRVPGLIPESIKSGNFSAEAPSTGGKAVLVVQNLRFVPGETRPGQVAVSVDGYDRAFLFETAFDGSTPQVPRERNVVTVNTVPPVSRGELIKARPTDKFPVRIEVDQPTRPDDYIEFGFDKSGTKEFETRLLPGDRERAVTLTVAGPEGALVFGSVVRDWAFTLDATGILGKRTLRARLLAPATAGGRPDPANDRELGADVREVLFDDSPPEVVKLVVPPTHERGTPLKVTATAADQESGIDRVLFFVGEPPAAEVRTGVRGKVYVAAPPPMAGGAYTAVVPVANTPGRIAVGVRVINGVGLATDATAEVELVDPKAKATTADIKGVVEQGSPPRKQPGRTVWLLDEKQAAILKTTETNAKGEFAFKDVKPGNYVVRSDKPTDYSYARKPVTVEAGKTTEVELSLMRTPKKQ